jgi:hypothetical protein
MSREQEQAVKDEYARRGFSVYNVESSRIGRSLLALLGKAPVEGVDPTQAALRELVEDAGMYTIDTLPFDMKVAVTADGPALPKTLDEEVRIAFWPAHGLGPFEFDAASSAVVFAFVDGLIAEPGNVNGALNAARTTQKAVEAQREESRKLPRNAAEAAVIEHYAQYGYDVFQMGPVRALRKNFEGGWHAITVPSENDTRGDLPQSLDEPVEAALHLDIGISGTSSTAVASATNSHTAIEAGEKAIETRKRMLAERPVPRTRNGQAVH